MLTSIDGHLHSPLIILVNVRLSPFFVFSTQSPSSYSIPPIVLYPWLTLMYCVKVEKVWDYSCIAWSLACHRGYRSWEHLCVTKMKHSLTIWFCRDELSLAMLFWEDMIGLISMLEVLLFLLSIWTFILYSFGSEHSCHNKENYIKNYAR